MVDPNIRSHAATTERRQQFFGIGHGFFARQELYTPHKGVQMKVGKPGTARFVAEAIKGQPSLIESAQAIDKPEQLIDGEIRRAIDLPVERLREILFDNMISHSLEGIRCDRAGI